MPAAPRRAASRRLLLGWTAAAAAALALLAPGIGAAQQPDRRRAPPPRVDPAESMTFVLAEEGPEDACRPRCRTWIVAQGRITPDTPKAFAEFVRNTKVDDLAVHLHSNGGTVRAALEIGSRFRALGFTTRVSRSYPVEAPAASGKRRYREAAEEGVCASACLFLLMGGKMRMVPERARVLVHQIWPGSARDDAASVAGATRTYTAREVASVQETNGRFAAFLVRMGADIELYEAINSVPPWVAMRLLSREELVRFRVVSAEPPAAPPALKPPPAPPAQPPPPVAGPPLAAPDPPPPPQPRAVPRLALAASGAGGQNLASTTIPTRTQDNRRGRYRVGFACAARAGYVSVEVEETLLGGEEPGERMRSAALMVRDRGVLLPARAPTEAEKPNVASGLALAAMLEPLAWDPSSRLVVEIRSTKGRPTRLVIAGPQDTDALRAALGRCPS